jgi:ectoine hydroxylase-related dioxygenase (phytanoyl-CoA dioxygenase family)
MSAMTAGHQLPDLNGSSAAADEQVDEYRRLGHTRIDGVLTSEQLTPFRRPIAAICDRARAAAKPIAQRSTYDRAFLQCMNLWRLDPVIEHFVRSPRLAATAAALLGVEHVRLYHDQALFKEPGGGMTPWHQDAVYWPLDGYSCITMWMPLVDVTPEMGVMTFANASHHDGRLGDDVISDESEGAFAALVEQQHFEMSTPTAMRAGDATFHSGWTLHRACGNSTEVMREVMTIIWFADGLTVLAPNGPQQENDLATWLPGLQPGDLADSPLNPIL